MKILLLLIVTFILGCQIEPGEIWTIIPFIITGLMGFYECLDLNYKQR